VTHTEVCYKTYNELYVLCGIGHVGQVYKDIKNQACRVTNAEIFNPVTVYLYRARQKGNPLGKISYL